MQCGDPVTTSERSAGPPAPPTFCPPSPARPRPLPLLREQCWNILSRLLCVTLPSNLQPKCHNISVPAMFLAGPHNNVWQHSVQSSSLRTGHRATLATGAAAGILDRIIAALAVRPGRRVLGLISRYFYLKPKCRVPINHLAAVCNNI